MELRRGAPVLWRSAGTTQVGTHPSARTVLAGLTLAQQHWITARGADARLEAAVCRPERMRLELALRARGVTAPDSAGHTEALTSQPGAGAPRPTAPRGRTGGVPSDAGDPSDPRTWTVAIDGVDAVTVQVARQLATIGVGVFQVRDDRRVDLDLARQLPPELGGTPRTSALAAVLARDFRGVTVRTTGDPTVVILSRARAHDLAATAALMADDVPHLAIRALEHGVEVGPMVFPGRTPCLRCAALAERDRDPSAPLMDLRAESVPLANARGLTRDRAATAAVALLLRGGILDPAATVPSACSLLVLDDGALQVPTHLLHPDCGCESATLMCDPPRRIP